MSYTFWIIILYLAAILLWFFLIWFLSIPIRDIFDILIIFIPLLVFAVAIASAGGPIAKEHESWIFRNNYVSSLSIILFPALIWAASKVDMHREFLLIVITATCFATLTFLDWWTSDDYFCFVKHFRTIFQTISITLVLVALRLFYLDQVTTRGKEDYVLDE